MNVFIYFFDKEFNECLNETLHQCHQNADCVDTKEEFFCKCKPGFYANGNKCSGKLLIFTKTNLNNDWKS